MTNVRKSVYRYDYRRSGDQDAGAIVRRPVVVVGAGPVGLATAIDLDPMIARPEGGPSSDMQRYEG